MHFYGVFFPSPLSIVLGVKWEGITRRLCVSRMMIHILLVEREKEKPYPVGTEVKGNPKPPAMLFHDIWYNPATFVNRAPSSSILPRRSIFSKLIRLSQGADLAELSN